MTTWWQFMNQPKQSCVNISINILELIVFITHIWLYGRFYISEFTCFSSFPPTSVAIYVHVSRKSCCDCIGYCELGALLRMGWHFHCTHGCYFYCTIPRQFILHLHRYNILRSPRGTQFWVSRSKKCLVKEWQYLVILRYSLTTYIIPFFNADVWKKSIKKGYLLLASFFSLSKSCKINCLT